MRLASPCVATDLWQGHNGGGRGDAFQQQKPFQHLKITLTYCSHQTGQCAPEFSDGIPPHGTRHGSREGVLPS